jgi:hypothetical protein
MAEKKLAVFTVLVSHSTRRRDHAGSFDKGCLLYAENIPPGTGVDNASPISKSARMDASARSQSDCRAGLTGEYRFRVAESKDELLNLFVGRVVVSWGV